MPTRNLQEAFEQLEDAERHMDDVGRRLHNLTGILDDLMTTLTRITTSVPSILDGRSIEQLHLELSASGYDQVIDIEEMTESGTALYEDIIPFPDFDHVFFNQHRITHPQNGSWSLRKAAVEEILLPVDQPMGEIEPCFCGNVYATTTATGDCHAPANMPACGHMFGRSCIANWLQSKNTCPMCRDKVMLPRLYSN